MELNDNKAGMEGLDKEKINTIIREMTNEKFGEHMKKKEAKIQARVNKQHLIIERLSDKMLNQSRKIVDDYIEKVESERDLTQWIVHIDMDAYFAAVEMRDNEKLRDIPMAVGGDAMLSTSNYPARKFGVRAAMPGFIAKKLCPHLTIVRGSYSKYGFEAQKVREVIAQFDPEFSSGGLDEAYMNLTKCCSRRSTLTAPVSHERKRYSGDCTCYLPRLPVDEDTSKCLINKSPCPRCSKMRDIYIDVIEFGHDVESIVQEMRFLIEQKTGLTASAGIAANSRLAKICSDINKPNNQYFLARDIDVIRTFAAELNLRKVNGIGQSSSQLLAAIGITTGSDVLAKRAYFPHIYADRTWHFLVRAALGIGSTNTTSDDEPQKSISREHTFSATADENQMIETLEYLAEKLAKDVEKAGVLGRTVTLTIKNDKFDRYQKTTSVLTPSIHTAKQLLLMATSLLKNELKENKSLKVRLLGIRLMNLEEVRKRKTISNYFQAGQAQLPIAVDSVTTNEDSLEAWGPIPKSGSVKPMVETIDEDDEIEELPQPSTSGVSKSTPKRQLDFSEVDAIHSCGATIDDFVCPICNQSRPTINTERAANEHIDNCINRRAIKAVIEADQCIYENKATSSENLSPPKKRAAKHLPQKRQSATLDRFLCKK